jgi:hypothetical protein
LPFRSPGSDLILDQQIEDVHNGRSPTNAVSVKRLSGASTKAHQSPQTALQAVRHLDDLTRDLLFGN